MIVVFLKLHRMVAGVLLFFLSLYCNGDGENWDPVNRFNTVTSSFWRKSRPRFPTFYVVFVLFSMIWLLVWFGFVVFYALSTVFQLYRGSQFYWWMKREYLEKTTDLSQDTDKLYQIINDLRLEVCATFVFTHHYYSFLFVN